MASPIKRRLVWKSPAPPTTEPEEGEDDEEEPEDGGMPLVPATPLAQHAVAAVGAAGSRRGRIAESVLTEKNIASIVRRCAQEWASLCREDPTAAVLEAVAATLELSGMRLQLGPEDIDGGPQIFLDILPERVRDTSSVVDQYPLFPKFNSGRRAVIAWEQFWAAAIAAQTGVGLLEGNFLDILSVWLTGMSKASIRSLRHVSTIASLALAEALGLHYKALLQTLSMHEMQLSTPGSRNQRQENQLKRDINAARIHKDSMYNEIGKILESTVPHRFRDIDENIRLQTLNQMDRLMRLDPELYLQNRWTARVFLNCHDPSADVRLRSLSVIHQWYSNTMYPDAVKDHLNEFAQRCLGHIVERCGDVDGRVAAMALKLLRLPALAERLDDKEFEETVNYLVGSTEQSLREEAALFVNSHVFQDPGICVSQKSSKPRRGRDRDDEFIDDRDVGDGVADDGADQSAAMGQEKVQEVYNSETSISMLMEFLESYVGHRLRLTERVVSAFWEKAPSLTSWSTMVNLCLVGENARGVGLEPINSMQRYALLYIMEGAVRQAEDEFHSPILQKKEAAARKLNDACGRIIPELSRLFDVCQPEERHCLLLSNMAKILLEYVVENSKYKEQAIVNHDILSKALVRAINVQAPFDTVNHCTDCLVALARCFNETKTAFLDVAKTWHHKCVELLAPESVVARAAELSTAMGRYICLSNRALDMTFGSAELLGRMLDLLCERHTWMLKTAASANAVASEPAPTANSSVADTVLDSSAEAEAATPAEPQANKPERPAEVPDARLTLRLIEAAATTMMWYIRMAVWFEAEAGTGDEEQENKAKEQLSEMLQGKNDFLELRKKLPHMFCWLRTTCAHIVARDRNPHVRFHAFSAYISICEVAFGASEKLNLEATSVRKPPATWDGLYEVHMPAPDMDALWKYLNTLYTKMPGKSVVTAQFEPDGQFVLPVDVYPAPRHSTNGDTRGRPEDQRREERRDARPNNLMTSARFFIQTCAESLGQVQEAEPEAPLTDEQELLVAVLCSRMVAESNVEDLITGPIGMLLVTQCERSRPKPLRRAALDFLKRLSRNAKDAAGNARLYYRVQEQAVSALFDCAGLDAARKLSGTLTFQWAPRLLPWLEHPFCICVHEAMISCITVHEKRLPLLGVFAQWIKCVGFLSSSQGQAIADSLTARCTEVGVDEANVHVAVAIKMLRRQVLAPPGAESNEQNPEAVAPAGVQADATNLQEEGEMPPPRRRFKAKRPATEVEHVLPSPAPATEVEHVLPSPSPAPGTEVEHVLPSPSLAPASEVEHVLPSPAPASPVISVPSANAKSTGPAAKRRRGEGENKL